MAEVHINHRFVSAIADDPDTTIVRPSNWNDTELFSQGNEGEVIVRRAASDTGASWETFSSNLPNVVQGPASVGDNTIALFDGTTGKLIKQDTHSGFIKATVGVISSVSSIVESDLSLTAGNTTNNATSTTHGFLPSLQNDASYFLNGLGSWAIPTVTESTINLTDESVVNDATSVRHGFLKILDNISTHYLNGQGNWADVNESTLTLTDGSSTNNSTTTRHGFLKQLDDDDTHFMDGKGNWDTVKDSDLSLSSITTNNATTSQHGFLPQLSADSTQYLNGNGGWSVPPGTNIKPSGYQYSKAAFSYGSGATCTDNSNLTVIHIHNIDVIDGQIITFEVKYLIDTANGGTSHYGTVSLYQGGSGTVGGTYTPGTFLTLLGQSSYDAVSTGSVPTVGVLQALINSSGTSGSVDYFVVGQPNGGLGGAESIAVDNVSLLSVQYYPGG
jgi:hypothetical protein